MVEENVSIMKRGMKDILKKKSLNFSDKKYILYGIESRTDTAKKRLVNMKTKQKKLPKMKHKD